MFQQRSNGKRTPEMHQFLHMFLYISKTKGLRENLTTPRDAAGIFPPETTSRSGKIPFVFNAGAKEFGKTCGADSGRQWRVGRLASQNRVTRVTTTVRAARFSKLFRFWLVNKW